MRTVTIADPSGYATGAAVATREASDHFGAEILRQRAARLRSAMKLRNLDALVLYSGPSWHGAGSATLGNVRYLTDVTDAWRGLTLVLPLEGEPALLLPGADTLMRQELWVGDVRVHRPVEHGRVARSIIEERCGASGRAGLVGRQEMPAPAYVELTGEQGRWAFEDADDVLGRLRMIKGPEEIARHRAAALLSDAMSDAGVESCRRPAERTWRIMADMESAARIRGAEYARTWISAAPNLEYLTRFPSDDKRQLRSGDQIMIGNYVTFDGYWGHSLRLGFKGTPTPQFRRVVQLLHEVQEAGFSKLRPGIPVGEIHRSMVKEVDRYFPGTGWGRSGHGLGLDYSDPIISDYFPDSDFAPPPTHGEVLLEPGMVLELHPGFRAPALGCNAPKIGDMCLITKDGYERLTQFPREVFEA